YQLSAHTEHVETQLKLRIATAFTNTVLETGHQNLDLPTVRQTSRVDVGAPDATGAHVTITVEAVDVLDDMTDPAVKARVVKEAGETVGHHESYRMDPSGAITEPQVDAKTRGEAAQLADLLQQSAVVFPVGEIGVGAIWQQASDHTFSGVRWHRVMKYTLEAVTDTTATIGAEVVMTAESQALRVEPNATTRLTSGKATSTLHAVVPLDATGPTATLGA